jgi:3-deoxy-D-manno-octulosonate 8-phosphate phosphatase (KDO 8-P phosphatase)
LNVDPGEFGGELTVGGRGAPTLEQLRALKLVVFDVDGVLTDGRIILNDRGEQSKFFDVRDGAGVTLLQLSGLLAALVTGRTSGVVDARARELKIPPERVKQGAKVKLPVLQGLLAELRISANEVAFVGDDLIDMEVMAFAALSFSPSDAPAEIKRRSHLVARLPGGRGAVRSIVEYILQARADGGWEKALNRYLGHEETGTHA